MTGHAPCGQCGHYENNIPLTGLIVPKGDNLMYEIEPGFTCKGCGMSCVFMVVSQGMALADSLFQKVVKVG